MSQKTIAAWHQFVQFKDPKILADLLAEDVTFHSPVVHTPQQGKAITTIYLTAAASVFNESFRYVREIISDNDAVLEFLVEIDGIQMNGIDMLSWNDDDQIVDFKVMLRPLKAINLLHQKMANKLQLLKQ